MLPHLSPKRAQTTQLGARIPSELYDRLLQTAWATGRTVGGIITVCCSNWLPHIEAETTPKDKVISLEELKRARKGGKK